MNASITPKTKRRIVFILIPVVAACVFFFFYRMYHDDIRALEDFVASYKSFDKVISDLDRSGADVVDVARDAARDLGAKASLRLSSLIRNDAELMAQAIEIADLARRETENLKVYMSDIQSPKADWDRSAEEYNLLKAKREAAYDRFQELAGIR